MRDEAQRRTAARRSKAGTAGSSGTTPRAAGTRPRCNLLGPTALGFRHRDDITEITSFVLFVAGRKHQALHDFIAGTVVLYDPDKVLSELRTLNPAGAGQLA